VVVTSTTKEESGMFYDTVGSVSSTASVVALQGHECWRVCEQLPTSARRSKNRDELVGTYGL